MFVCFADRDLRAPAGAPQAGRQATHGLGWAGRISSLVFLFCSGFLSPAQTSAPPAVLPGPGGRVIFQGAGVAPGVPPLLDPQVAALMQQSGLDTRLTVTAEFDPPVAVLGQAVTYRVTVTAMIEGVSLPDAPPAPPGLRLALTGRGFNYANAGGLLQPRTTLNYRALPRTAGAYVMPSYNGSANGKLMKVPEARLVVLPPGAAGGRQSMRLVAEVPPEDCFIGQSVPVRLALLDPGDNSVQAISQPQVSGEAVLSELAFSRQSREVRTNNNRMVSAYLTSIQVTPIKEGRIEFTAQAYAHIARPGVNPAFGSAFDTVLISSEPVALTVRHLPKEGELPGFTGGIGSFQVEVPRVSTNTVRAGEPLTLTVQVRGEGNLTRLLPPRIERARGWQVFPPLLDSPGALQMLARGSSVFTYTLIPLSDQVQATPAIPFCFFDLKRKAYVDATIPPVPIRVLPGPGGPTPLTELAKPSAPGLDDPDQPGADREPIMTGLAETPDHRASSLVPLQARAWFLVLQLVPAATLGGLWLWDRRRRYLAQHPDLVLKARARHRLRRLLRSMRHAAAREDAAGFVTAAVNALREACAPLEAANPAALVCADVLRGLSPTQRLGAEGRLVRDLFTAADAHHFLDQAPEGAALLKLRPDIEALLAQWRARL
jgi:hypothetical protein